jgi:hypothetical protein
MALKGDRSNRKKNAWERRTKNWTSKTTSKSKQIAVTSGELLSFLICLIVNLPVLMVKAYSSHGLFQSTFFDEIPIQNMVFDQAP